jgi:hypothetical protein
MWWPGRGRWEGADYAEQDAASILASFKEMVEAGLPWELLPATGEETDGTVHAMWRAEGNPDFDVDVS